MKTSTIFLQPTLCNASPEYILEHNPPKTYIPDTNPAMVAVEPIAVAYSVTVDISAYITRAVKSNAPNIRKNDFVNIFSDSLTVIILNNKIKKLRTTSRIIHFHPNVFQGSVLLYPLFL